ncbi:isochorismatase family protein [Microlunatus soli]|uniref:Nicotinamidase-related amidase n=1 Tax=Microlunatus soli TaxID=630515 RepID=A0A1H1Y9W7_9ACTN|nr:isochorismatase family protein [Microlunatus soli]SDT18227.1 Nicotinamidase-related amidase [Microlunatus soli]
MTQNNTTHSLDNRELVDFYRQAGFGGRVGWGSRPAVLVIDMAGNWTEPEAMIGSDLGGVTQQISRVLTSARDNSVPVLFTTMAYDAAMSDVSRVSRLKTPHAEKMIRGEQATQVIAELERRADEPLIEKPRASAFLNTNLISILVDRGIDTVVIVGCSTSGCIRATSESALDLGFHAIVPAEAVGDRSPSAHTANLFDIDQRYADVVPVEDVIQHFASGQA